MGGSAGGMGKRGKDKRFGSTKDPLETKSGVM